MHVNLQIFQPMRHLYLTTISIILIFSLILFMSLPQHILDTCKRQNCFVSVIILCQSRDFTGFWSRTLWNAQILVTKCLHDLLHLSTHCLLLFYWQSRGYLLDVLWQIHICLSRLRLSIGWIPLFSEGKTLRGCDPKVSFKETPASTG